MPEERKGFETCVETWEEEGFKMFPVKGDYQDLKETPLEMVPCSLRISLPFAIKMQFFKSDRGFKWTEKMPDSIEASILAQESDFSQNEVSRRYVDSEPEFANLSEWHYRHEESIKQGAGSFVEGTDKERATSLLSELNHNSLDTYNKLLEMNITPEEARFALSTSSITHFIQTGGLLDWTRIHYLRSSKDAQKMIRDVSLEINKVLSAEFGDVWEQAKREVAESYI